MSNIDRRLVGLAGSQLLGAGTLRFESGTRFDVHGQTRLEPRLVMVGSSAAYGPGLLTLASNQDLTGFYGCPVALAPGVSAVIQSATFTNHVMISSNATMTVMDSHFMRSDGVITNFGTLRLAAGYPVTYDRLTGNGCLVIGGRCEIYRAQAGSGAARIHTALTVLPTGNLVVQSNANLALAANSCLLNAGTVEVQAGARLDMIETSFRDFVLFAKSRIAGSGEVVLGDGKRLLILGSSTLAGGTLQLTGAATMAGYGRLYIAPGARFLTDHSVTFPGAIDVGGTLTLTQSGITLQINSVLTLAAGGVLNNPGIVRVGFYVNQGGVVNGNAPVLLGGGGLASVEWLRIDSLTVVSPSGVGEPSSANPELLLRWTGSHDDRFVVETSIDWRTWTSTEASVHEVTFGVYEGRVRPNGRHGFYRLRSIEP